MFLDVFGKEFREEICLEKCSKMPKIHISFFFFLFFFYNKSRGLGGKIDFWKSNSNFDP